MADNGSESVVAGSIDAPRPDSASSSDLSDVQEIAEIRRLAVQQMPEALRAFVDCDGADQALVANEDAWRQWALRPRVLIDVSEFDAATMIAGQEFRLPVVVAPFAGSLFCHPDAEVALAQGAMDAGTLLTLSLRSFRSPEDLQAIGAPFWFHMDLKVSRNRELAKSAIERAEAAGARALCLTVDLPIFPPLWPPNMMAAMRASFNYVPYSGLDDRPNAADLPGNIERIRRATRSRATWTELEWLCGETDLPVLLKGIQTSEDAQLACDAGVAGVIVSNHGGHAALETLGTAEMLPEVVNAVAGRCDVLVDGGIRRGADVFRAIALGASGVLVGRCALWGLAAGGAGGVARALDILREELQVEMALTGARSVAEINRSMITRRGEPFRSRP